MAALETAKPRLPRRLLDFLSDWSKALEDSGCDYRLDRIAVLEQEIAQIKDQVREIQLRLGSATPNVDAQFDSLPSLNR